MPCIAVAGISGKVGDSLRRYCPAETKITGLVHKRTPVTDGLAGVIEGFDITEQSRVQNVVTTLAKNGVRTIINCAAQIDLDGVEGERYAPDPASLSAYRLNTRGAELLAEACATASAEGTPILLIHLSSESVFGDNIHGKKYTEDDDLTIPRDHTGAVDYRDTVAMPTFYGLTKALGELRVLAKHREGSVVVRMHGVQGPQGGLFARTASEIQKSEPFTRVANMYVAHLPDSTIARALLALEEAMHDSERQTRGIYHLSASTALTPYDIALQFAERFQKRRSLITPITLEQLIESGRKSGKPLAPQPHYTILGISKFEREFYSTADSRRINRYLCRFVRPSVQCVLRKTAT